MSVKEKPKYYPDAIIGKQMKRLDSYFIGSVVNIYPFQKKPETVIIRHKIVTGQERNPMVKLADGRIVAGATAARIKASY